LLLSPIWLFWVGCLKTLDESKLDQAQDGGDASGGSSAFGGSSGSGGTGATGGSTGGSSGTPSDAPPDAPAPTITPHSSANYPTSNIATGAPPQIVAADDSYVYRADYDKPPTPAPGAQLSRHPIGGGSGTLLASALARPQALVARIGSAFVFIAAGDATTDEGSILRVPKAGGGVDTIGLPQPIERAIGIYAAADGFAYVSAKAITKDSIAVLRFSLSGGTQNASALYAGVGNESGGDIVVSNCVYWISNGNVWVLPLIGGSRSSALETPITDAVGITADAANFYYTRSNGEIWQRQLSAASCAGGGAAEKRISWGAFIEIGDIITYDGMLAWTAKGDGSAELAGGIFTTPVGGGSEIVQIAPHGDTPVDIDQSPDMVVYATSLGVIKRVPKQTGTDN
jgi:hypothetical protein